LAICGAFLLRGQLQTWVQHTPAGPALTAMFRGYLLPPSQARPALTTLINSAPHDAMLYRLRAHEAELALDFTAAEADWKAYAANAPDHYKAQMELADFYFARIRPRDEVAALTVAATAKDDPLLPANEQRGWHAFERMASAAPDAGVFRAWVARYPKEPTAWRKLIDFLIDHRQFAAAETEIARYGRMFDDQVEPVRMRAELEVRRGSPDAALAIYDRAFQPDWSEDMQASYFKLLEQQGKLRDFSGRARTALEANPADLDATARLFQYFRSQKNLAAARRALLEYRIAKESGKQPWTAAELETLAQLFGWLPDPNETARLYYALYSIPPASGPQVELALQGLANLLLDGEPIQFGSGDLSFYKDIATIDSSPGFLNGVLSLVLNGTGPRWEYQKENEKSYGYFHRAAGARLLELLEQKFPKSKYRAPLRAKLVSAYAAYGDDVTVIRAGREYLAAFPHGDERVSVMLLVADALARADQTTEEFALYDQMLRELATQASGMPTRSGQYTMVLDKYLGRLAAVQRPLDALRVYRREIDRNPNDPALYLRLAAFVEQNGMSREVEEVYTKAIAKFGDPSWYDKLARWYLRHKQTSALATISRQAVDAFSGSDLEQYFREIVTATHPDAALYLQLNLYAHERFPEDMAFVHNLLNAYSRQGTYDGGAAEKLLRQYWFYDAQLRSRFFEKLSREGRLTPELAAIRSANPQLDQALATNPAAVQFQAEAEAWLSHFEAAAPAWRVLATAYPGSPEFTGRGSMLYRSLAAYFKEDTDIGLTLAGYEQRANPRDQSVLARMGDILADRELFSRARTLWDRIPAVEPNKPDGYLEAATVYWDYYKYNDAMRWIDAARKKFKNPALYAYQAGAIDENKRAYASAVHEYVAGALAGEGEANGRLLRLLQRPLTRDAIDRETAAAVASDPSPQALTLRISVLETQQRRPELEALLTQRIALEKSPEELTELQETARRLGFDASEKRASERLAAITNDPVDKMRLTLEYARLLESKKDLTAAAGVVDALYRQHPLILGVMRGDVDFHVRNQQPDAAIDILADASKHARADLAADFTLESGRIATTAGQFDRARTLLSGLLAADPLKAEYLAAMADTYLQAKDDRGFRDYELATIQRLGRRTDRIAAIRRALIPALNRLKDTAGAVDQYIQVINSYPEDEALTKEAAGYAVAHGQFPRLVAIYRKTIGEAPRDYRWPIVLGRIETTGDDYPAAIADYEQALKDRPDRADVLEAEAHLEERLLRFDAAVASYARLYDLTYRDPQWMTKVAELRARLGQNAEAVSALKAAMIGARTETADADFAIAERLYAWHLLGDAVSFAERGAKLDKPPLIYTSIMTAARRLDIDTAASNQQVAQTAGAIIRETYTPEEKARLAETLAARGNGQDALMPLVEAAGLLDLEARWRLESMHGAIDGRFVTLQTQRGLYGELGQQLERFASQKASSSAAAGALVQAAAAYRAEGDTDSEMRVLQMALTQNALGGEWLDRYFQLLIERQPDQLPAIARSGAFPEIRNRAVQMAIASDRQDLAYSAIRIRGTALPPVWTRAYTALTGDYFADRSTAVDASFRAALDTRTIGERLKIPPLTQSMIVGSVWFYYGARYGEYLRDNPEAEAWLPASLEAAPDSANAYVALGDWYTGPKAIHEFELALELDPDRADAHDHIARVLWSQGRKPEAIAQWKSAMATLLRVQGRGVKVPEWFWSRAAETFTDIGERHALRELRGDIAHLLTDYYQRNNSYRLNELIEPAARSSIASGDGTAWLLELAHTMDNPGTILTVLMETPGVTDAQRISLQRELVAIRAKQVGASFGDALTYLDTALAQARWQLISMLLDAGDVNGATEVSRQIPPNLIPDTNVQIRLAARNGTLGAVLKTYESRPDYSVNGEALLNAAATLRKAGDENGARSVLEFVYEREIRAGRLNAANFLGLAEVKLQRNEATAAIALLNRMALVVEDGFDTLVPAAELLSKYGKNAEAQDFLRRRIKAVPWDSDAKLRLARMLPAATPERKQLLAVAAVDSQAPYAVRAEAAGTTPEDAARQTNDPRARLRLWRDALAMNPEDTRVRLSAVRVALAVHRDSLALALGSGLQQLEPSDLEALAAAAERVDDLPSAQRYLQTAIDQHPPDRNALVRRLSLLIAEQNRRAKNIARQPAVKNVIEQDHVVGPRVARSAQ
jgi:Tfp pilus assembly protein PilF